VIRRLNPIIRGWAAYYRTQVSSRTFAALDHYLWKLTYRCALISHRNKSRPWVFARYFGKFNRTRQDRWVFGDRTSGAFMHRFAWTGIARHQIVRYRASPDDPALTEYWASRRRKAPLPVSRTNRWLLAAQDGRCHACNGTLHAAADQPQTPGDLERWLATNRATITTIPTRTAGTDEAELRLIHAHCANRAPRPAPLLARRAPATRSSRMR
jgi:RNA-directed DNA polymerase